MLVMGENGDSSVAVRRIHGLDRGSNYNVSSGMLQILSDVFDGLDLNE